MYRNQFKDMFSARRLVRIWEAVLDGCRLTRVHLTGMAFVVLLSSGLLLVGSRWLNIPLIWEIALLHALTYLAFLLATQFFLGNLRPVPKEVVAVRCIWGPILDSLIETISLAEQRLDDAQNRLESTKRTSPEYLILWMGYRAIRTAWAIHLMCERGYANQAYSMCRELMEMEVNTFFIMTSGDPEGTCKRYHDWSKVKSYHYVEHNKGRHDITDEEWARMTTQYQEIIREYEAKGEDVHNKDWWKRDWWAVAWRDGKFKRVEGGVADRALHSMPYLKSDRHRLHAVWSDWWENVNRYVHNDPRALSLDLGAPGDDMLVTRGSVYGLEYPIRVTARTMLNISTLISDNISAKQTESFKALTMTPRRVAGLSTLVGAFGESPY